MLLLIASTGVRAADPGRPPANGREPARAETDSTVPMHAMRPSLAIGPNGPIPAIVVDQFGYPPSSRKIAVLRDPQKGYDSTSHFTPGRSIALVDVASGRIIEQGEPRPWNGGATDATSGDRAWCFDFSHVTRTGRYAVVDVQAGLRSAEFTIAPDVYGPVLRSATRMFFYQRAGATKSAEHAGAAWADAASHLGRGQDAASMPWPGTRRPSGAADSPARDLRGGWYDAGDYNKYTTWTARNIIILLSAYAENPAAFTDDTRIPESGNAVADLLDEVRWGLDWLVRMQEPDGSVLCVQSLSSASPPSSAKGPSHYGPATTSASLMAAAAFAYASKVYGALDKPDLKAFSEDLKRRAVAAWTWAQGNPSAIYWNNDEARQPGSKGLAAGQQELQEPQRALARFEAALYIFEITGDPALKAFVEANFEALTPKFAPSLWEIEVHEALLRFARVEGIAEELRKKVRSRFVAQVRPVAARFAEDLRKMDPYRAPIPQYTWGSNKAKAMQARLFQLVAQLTDEPDIRNAARAAALEYVHYIHGVNPLGLVYLTNMGAQGAAHSANTLFHSWFARGTRWTRTSATAPGPPPGFLVGGPNPQFKIDACCSAPSQAGAPLCWSAAAAAACKQNYAPPAGQPPAKSYLQFNAGWPANSWEISEPSDGYQAYYIQMLAAFVAAR